MTSQSSAQAPVGNNKRTPFGLAPAGNSLGLRELRSLLYRVSIISCRYNVVWQGSHHPVDRLRDLPLEIRQKEEKVMAMNDVMTFRLAEGAPFL